MGLQQQDMRNHLTMQNYGRQNIWSTNSEVMWNVEAQNRSSNRPRSNTQGIVLRNNYNENNQTSDNQATSRTTTIRRKAPSPPTYAESVQASNREQAAKEVRDNIERNSLVNTHNILQVILENYRVGSHQKNLES